jgi:alkylated DNA repair dioxygenase AlkB
MQSDLFANHQTEAIPGLRYATDFLSREEEAQLLAVVRTLPMHPARYKDYLARRQVVGFGGSYDFDTNTLLPGAELDQRLLPLRDRVADWLGVDRAQLVHVMVAEYAPGTPLG